MANNANMLAIGSDIEFKEIENLEDCAGFVFDGKPIHLVLDITKNYSKTISWTSIKVQYCERNKRATKSFKSNDLMTNVSIASFNRLNMRGILKHDRCRR